MACAGRPARRGGGLQYTDPPVTSRHGSKYVYETRRQLEGQEEKQRENPPQRSVWEGNLCLTPRGEDDGRICTGLGGSTGETRTSLGEQLLQTTHTGQTFQKSTSKNRKTSSCETVVLKSGPSGVREGAPGRKRGIYFTANDAG